MERLLFKMYLKAGFENEYQQRHQNIWPEIVELLKKNGISEYSIFWDRETNELIGFQKKAGEISSQNLGDVDIMKKWWKYMSDIMETNSDESPISIPLREVFYME